MSRKQSPFTSQILSLASSAGSNGVTISELIQAIPEATPAQVRFLLQGLLGRRAIRATNRSRRSVSRTNAYSTVYEVVQKASASSGSTSTQSKTLSKTTKAVSTVKRGRPTEAVRQKRIRDAIALLKKAGIKKVA